jgi:hypothetical protein
MRAFGFVLSGGSRLCILVECLLLDWLRLADQGKPALCNAQPGFFIDRIDSAISPILGIAGLFSVLVVLVHAGAIQNPSLGFRNPS